MGCKEKRGFGLAQGLWDDQWKTKGSLLKMVLALLLFGAEGVELQQPHIS